MRPYTMAERARCKWVGSLGVAAMAQRDDGERQLGGWLVNILPPEPLRDVLRRARHVLGLHATIHDGGTCALQMGRQCGGCGNGISIIQINGTSTPSTNSVVAAPPKLPTH